MIIPMEDADADSEDLINLIMEFGEEYGLPGGCERYAVCNVIDMIIDDGVGLVAFRDGEIAGAVGGILHNNPFNSNIKMLTETFWYVRKKYRGKMVGGGLLAGYLDQAEKSGANIAMTLLDTTIGIEENFVKRGFRLREKTFIKWAK